MKKRGAHTKAALKSKMRMKTNDLLTVSTVALTTATLCLAAFWNPSLEAGGDSDVIPAKIATPKLITKGVELTLSKTGAAEVREGDQPVFELAAINTTQTAAQFDVRLAMSATSLRSAMSRMVELPGPLWHCDQSIVLKPGERKTFTLATHTKMPAGRLVSVTLTEASPVPALTPGLAIQLPNAVSTPPGIAVLTFSTPAKPLLAGSLGSVEKVSLNPPAAPAPASVPAS